MLIRVMYRDVKFDMVSPKFLNNLLKEKKVTCFMRSKSWAILGRDSIRSASPNDYEGVERRAV